MIYKCSRAFSYTLPYKNSMKKIYLGAWISNCVRKIFHCFPDPKKTLWKLLSWVLIRGDTQFTYYIRSKTFSICIIIYINSSMCFVIIEDSCKPETMRFSPTKDRNILSPCWVAELFLYSSPSPIQDLHVW